MRTSMLPILIGSKDTKKHSSPQNSMKKRIFGGRNGEITLAITHDLN
jgi:hypothetical protein